jgi:hypothetical protein
VKRYRDEVEVVRTAMPVPPEAWLFGVLVLLAGAVVVALAVMGNVIAIMAITAVSTTVLIVIGFAMGIGRKKAEYQGQALNRNAGNESWRLEMEERVALLNQVADTQARQALTQNRSAGAEARLGRNGSVEELIMGHDYTDSLS